MSTEFFLALGASIAIAGWVLFFAFGGGSKRSSTNSWTSDRQSRNRAAPTVESVRFHQTQSPIRNPESSEEAALRTLGIDSSATFDDVVSAYRKLVRDYHPDRTAHLGKELQEVAHRKTVELQAAFSLLSKRTNPKQGG